MTRGAKDAENASVEERGGNGWMRGGESGRRWVFRRRNVTWLTLAIIVAAGFGLWLAWERSHQLPAQLISLPDGSIYQFAGTTWSTRNIPPTAEAQLVNWLPPSLVQPLRKLLGDRVPQPNSGAQFDAPQLFVWFKRLGTNAAPRSGRVPGGLAALSNEAGVESGVRQNQAQLGTNWIYAAFPVVPRRDRTLALTLEFSVQTVETRNNAPFYVGSWTPAQSIRFRNPLFGRHPQWQPEKLPQAKQVEDLNVRLEDFEANSWFTAKAKLAATLASGSNDVWKLQAVELSDATGNRLRSDLQEHSLDFDFGSFNTTSPNSSGQFETQTRGLLWPDEAAWRLKLEFRLRPAFTPPNLILFTNLPVPATNTSISIGTTKTVNQHQIELVGATRDKQRLSVPSGPSLHASMQYQLGDAVTYKFHCREPDLVLDYREMPDNTGAARFERLYESNSCYYATFALNSTVSTNAQTMNVAFVIQQTRSVEFLVAPSKSK